MQQKTKETNMRNNSLIILFLCVTIISIVLLSCTIGNTEFFYGQPKYFSYYYEGTAPETDMIQHGGYYSNDDYGYIAIFYSDGSLMEMNTILNKDSLLSFRDKFIYYCANWGVYHVNAQKIKAQIVNHIGWWYELRRSHYTIKSDSTLVVYNYEGDRLFMPLEKQKYNSIPDSLVLSFHRLDNIVKPAYWLKMKKWYWKDKKAYKAFKKKYKSNRNLRYNYEED